MKRMFIEPLDVLMFRSERPFIARESYVARHGVISPPTFEGAIKSKVFLKFCKKKGYLPSDFQRRKREAEKSFEKRIKEKMKKDEELEKILEGIGHPAACPASSINVLGVFFSKKEGRKIEGKEWFPIPNDIVVRDNEEEEEILKLSPALKREFRISGVEEYACFTTYSKVRWKRGLMKFDALMKYLKEGMKPEKTEIIKVPYDLELRTGIKLEKRAKRTVEGHLYTAEFLRLKDWKEKWGFVVWLEDKDGLIDKYFDNNEIVRLGGEGRGAICTKIDEIDLAEKVSELIEKINSDGRFKLYLATPSYFNGYKPPNNILKYELGLNKIELIAALPGKPIYVGGYDFAMNREKPLRRLVNAGAVYYYRFEGEIRNNLTLPIKIIDKNIDMRCGFIGRW